MQNCGREASLQILEYNYLFRCTTNDRNHKNNFTGQKDHLNLPPKKSPCLGNLYAPFNPRLQWLCVIRHSVPGKKLLKSAKRTCESLMEVHIKVSPNKISNCTDNERWQ